MPHDEYFWAAGVLAALLAVLFLGRLFLKRRETPRTRRRRSSR